MKDEPATSRTTAAAAEPWWNGTVCPTMNFRWKCLNWASFHRANDLRTMVLQQMVTDTGGRRRHWRDVPFVAESAPDDE